MEPTTTVDTSINFASVRAIADSWPRRAAVRQETYLADSDHAYDIDLPDYPLEMVPFRKHDSFKEASPAQVEKVLTLAWLVYNQRTISAEEHLANPAFYMIKDGHFPGVDDLAVQQGVLQSIIDENFHTLMHLTAMHRTCELRGIASVPQFPHAITYRRMKEAMLKCDDARERDLINLVYAITAEISVNAYLDLIAKNDTIQPMHSKIATLHNHDEYMHSSLLTKVAQLIFHALNDKQQHTFIKLLPEGLRDFAEHDFSAWKVVLDMAGFKDSQKIIDETTESAKGTNLLRDYSGLNRLAKELNIIDKLDFEFASPA